ALGVATVSAEDLVGKPAPPFELKGLDGNTYKLSDYKGKIVVLEWANKDCPVWRKVLPMLNETATKYAGKDQQEIVWLAIDSTYSMAPEDVREYAKANKVERPILDDREGKVGKAYGARTTPHMFIINQEGVVVYDGGIDNQKKGGEHVNYVAKALDEIKAGKDVSEANTNPYGCAVKYKP